ncbi:MAG: type II toxin-antitoxin system RelE/ParE family toxin [Planctomycetes bacterium]|nr:type II toxin-antitoxin system RelE/ParE family toxin [Planctomycetota bacterium]
MAYRIRYSTDAETHLRALSAAQRSLVLDTVDRQLRHQPTSETRNRKFMRPNPLAPWELRIRNLRVFYDVLEEPEQVVVVHAIGIKVGNRVVIAGEEWSDEGSGH